MSGTGLAASVVIPTVGRPDLLAPSLRAVLAQETGSRQFEVIVVSDGPDPATASLVESMAVPDGPPLRHLTREAGPGSPGATRNVGWRSAGGELIAFLDDDCVPQSRWLAAGLDAHAADSESLIQGPTRPAPEDEGRRGPFSRIARIEQLGPYFQSCNIFYPRALLERLGGFDESFASWGEDVDLGWRALEAGAGAIWAGEALAHHAVLEEGAWGHLRFARREAATVRLMKRHPGLRLQTAYARYFVKRSHARLLLAFAGLLMVRRMPAAALLCLPYLRGLRGRITTTGGDASTAAYLIAYDLIEVTVTARASAAERTALL